MDSREGATAAYFDTTVFLGRVDGFDQDEGAGQSEEGGEELEIGRIKELAEAYHVYNQLLLADNYLDFGDLIIYTLKLFRERPNILRLNLSKFFLIKTH